MKCNICNSANFQVLYNIKSYDIFKCQGCGLIFMNPNIPAGDEAQFLQKMYETEYFDGKTDANIPGYAENYITLKRNDVQINAKRNLKKIEQFHPAKGALLEIGCAAGFFLDVARSRGWKVTGVEISSEVVEYGRTELKLDIRQGIFEAIELPDNSFDVIAAWDVIEHILDLEQFLSKVNKLLKNDGLLVLGTPNVGSLARKLRQKKWYHFKPPEHIFYFNQSTLGLVLQKYFGNVQVKLVYPPYSKIKPSLKACFRFILYTGFNLIAKTMRLDEYLIAFASKSK